MVLEQAPELTVGQPCGSLSEGNMRRIFVEGLFGRRLRGLYWRGAARNPGPTHRPGALLDVAGRSAEDS
eukprot:1193516-Prorocentrum_minimum.AAC.3